jgi:hypothetical protein
VNHAKPGAQVVALALALVVFFGCLSASGCSPSRKITVESDPRVFTLFAGLAAVGYGEEQADPTSETLRAQLKEALSDWTTNDLYPMTSLEQSYGPGELISAILQLGPPPDFPAGDQGSLPGLQAFLARIWTQIEPLYESSRETDARALAAMADSAAAVVQGAIDYAGGNAPCKTWSVVPESLVPPGYSYSYRTRKIAWIVISPASDSWRSDLARATFRILMHDRITELDAQGALERFQPLLERLSFDGGLAAYVEESLAWAVAARTYDSAEREATLSTATEKGFVLAPKLVDRLADYETSGETLLGYLAQLLADVDVDAALALVGPTWVKWEGVGWSRNDPDQILQGWVLRVDEPITLVVLIDPTAGRGVEASLLRVGTPDEEVPGAVDEVNGWDVFWWGDWEASWGEGLDQLLLVGKGTVWAFAYPDWTCPNPPPSSWQFVSASGE